MSVSDEYLATFKELYKQKFGKDLSEQEAYDKAIRLLRMVEVIYHRQVRDMDAGFTSFTDGV